MREDQRERGVNQVNRVRGVLLEIQGRREQKAQQGQLGPLGFLGDLVQWVLQVNKALVGPMDSLAQEGHWVRAIFVIIMSKCVKLITDVIKDIKL